MRLSGDRFRWRRFGRRGRRLHRIDGRNGSRRFTVVRPFEHQAGTASALFDARPQHGYRLGEVEDDAGRAGFGLPCTYGLDHARARRHGDTGTDPRGGEIDDQAIRTRKANELEFGRLIERDLGAGSRGTAAQLQAIDFTGMHEIPGQRREQRHAQQEFLKGSPRYAHGP